MTLNFIFIFYFLQEFVLYTWRIFLIALTFINCRAIRNGIRMSKSQKEEQRDKTYPEDLDCIACRRPLVAPFRSTWKCLILHTDDV
jgi:hypothetical protein